MIGYCLFGVWVLISLFSLATNRDIFSPVKMYLFSVGFYFANIFTTSYGDAVTLTYAALLLLGMLLSIRETFLRSDGGIRFNNDSLSVNGLRSVAVVLWLFTVVPLAAQVWLIMLMGGIYGYVNTLGMRVIEYRGLGPVTMIIGVLPVINIVYFSVGVVNRKTSFIWWLGYAVHACLFVCIGLASGSRGGLLNNCVLMIMVFHYTRRRVPLIGALIVAVSILCAASLLGQARNGIKIEEGGTLRTGLDNGEQSFESSHFHYGLDPLELVFSRPPDDLQLGLTFASVFTNLVPRLVWPEKPDTGGVVLTKLYTGDAWDGASNLSTGLIAESVLNFGWWIGVPCGFILVFMAMSWTIGRYTIMLGTVRTTNGCLLIRPVVGYLLMMVTATSLLCGEFTSSLVSSVVGRLLPLAIIAGTIVRVAGRERQNCRAR